MLRYCLFDQHTTFVVLNKFIPFLKVKYGACAPSVHHLLIVILLNVLKGVGLIYLVPDFEVIFYWIHKVIDDTPFTFPIKISYENYRIKRN